MAKVATKFLRELMMYLRPVFIFAVVIVLANCSFFSERESSQVTNTPKVQEVPVEFLESEDSQATAFHSSNIIFIRSSLVASAVEASVFDVSNGVPRLISSLKNNSKVSYSIMSGRHTFMVLSGSSVDFLRLDASGGRTYYSLVKPRMGVWKPSFDMAPVKMALQTVSPQMPSQQDSNALNDEVHALLLETEWVKDENVLAPIAIAEDKIQTQYNEGWNVWLEQSKKDQAKNTLDAVDGVKHNPYL